MSASNRRQFLNALLGGALGAPGTVILASATLRSVLDAEGNPQERDLRRRADKAASAHGPLGEEEASQQYAIFRNAGFRRGGFNNGAFRNAAFRNGAFRNGAFRRGGFRRF
jgi:hypothetical protein